MSYVAWRNCASASRPSATPVGRIPDWRRPMPTTSRMEASSSTSSTRSSIPQG